jgi:carbon storage regulator
MLVLTREVGEKVVIADEVKVTVLEISGGQVKLGFEAPDDIAIHRLEIWERIRDGGTDDWRTRRIRRKGSSGASPDEAAS